MDEQEQHDVSIILEEDYDKARVKSDYIERSYGI